MATERDKRNLRWQELPPSLRARFRAEVAQSVERGVPEKRAKDMAWTTCMRLDAWRRRGGDAKPCERCGTSVLWRFEGKRAVPTLPNGGVHACE